MSDGPDFDFEICVNEFGVYCVPEIMRKREVCRIMLKGEVNEPRTLTFIRGLVKEGDVVSGGAFIGDFLPAISKAMGSDQTLYSFEPNPMSFAAALETIRLSDLHNVQLLPVAVGDKNTTVPLEITSEEGRALGGISKIVEAPIEGRTVEATVTTVDDIVDENRRVSLIHLDIEDFEWKALLGARKTIQRCHPFIILEAGPEEKRLEYAQNLAKVFPEIGYQLVGIMDRNAFFRPENRE